jgi:hypothetical protein
MDTPINSISVIIRRYSQKITPYMRPLHETKYG